MSKKLFVSFILAATLLSACSGAPSDKQAGGSSSSKIAKIADAPEGCPSYTELTAKTSDLKEMTFVPKNSWMNVWSSTPERSQFVFSTYEVSKGNPYGSHTYTDTDALVVVNVTDSVSNKVGVGNYLSAQDAKMRVKEANVSSKNLAGGVFDKNGSFEVTYSGEKYICGKMKFDDGRSLLKGEFIAEVAKF